MESLTEILGKMVLIGGGSIAITFACIRWFGSKWFTHQFAKRLEEFKRKQTELLEQFRFEVNTRLSRVSKVHEKEFEVLSDAWHRLQDAYIHLMSVANPGQQWPNLDRYTDPELATFLESCELHEFQKEELRKADDKMSYYQKKAYWIRRNLADSKVMEFQRYIAYNQIFLSRDLFDLFGAIKTSMIEAAVELEYPDSDDRPWRGTSKVFRKLKDKVDPLISQVESAVQKRLHFERP